MKMLHIKFIPRSENEATLRKEGDKLVASWTKPPSNLDVMELAEWLEKLEKRNTQVQL